ncbi:Clp protease N-terminal domain-containing protein [Plantactinospora sp. DSM 117369]
MVEQLGPSTRPVEFGDLTHHALWMAYYLAASAGRATVRTDDLWQVLPDVARYEAFDWPQRWTRQVFRFRRGDAEPDHPDNPVSQLPVPGLDWEIDGTLRETQWLVRRGTLSPIPALLARISRTPALRSEPEWTPGVRNALADALLRAYPARLSSTNALHLMLGLTADPAHRAIQAIGRQRLDVATLRREILAHPHLDQDGANHRHNTAFESLFASRGQTPLWVRFKWGVIRKMARVSRLGPLRIPLEGEARRQAVRLGQGIVTASHMMLSMLRTDDRLRLTGLRLRPADQQANSGARVLRLCGVSALAVFADAVQQGVTEEADPDLSIETLRRSRSADPPMGTTMGTAYRRAEEMALGMGHPYAGTLHLLSALVDGNADVGALLRRVGADPVVLRDRVAHELTLVEPR